MWDKYDNCYRNVVDIEDLKKYIQDKTIEIKDKEVKDMFISASQSKLDTISALDKILEDLENCEV
jgi:hypothetical protein